MKRRLNYVLTAAVSVVLTLTAVVLLLNIDVTNLATQIPIIRKVAKTDSLVHEHYLFDYDAEQSADTAALGYISALGDDYADYYNTDRLTAKNEQLKGENGGIGITVAELPNEGGAAVAYVHSKSPAAEAGLKKGDILLSVNGEDLTEKTIAQTAELIKSITDDSLTLEIMRDGKRSEVKVKIEEYIADSVTGRMVDGLGYIKIISFNNTTSEQFDDTLKSLQDSGAKSLIVDLRNNPGGTVDSCAAVLNKLLPEGDTVTVEYKNGKRSVMFRSDANCVDMQIAVLVNQGSASASEIFALAVRDFERGVLIGTKTYGKGVMQTTYSLGDKTAVKFTTAQIIGKDGETYHGKGLEPDIEVALTEEQSDRFYFLDDADDPQLQAAIEYFNK